MIANHNSLVIYMQDPNLQLYLPEGYVMDVVFFTSSTDFKSDGKGN